MKQNPSSIKETPARPVDVVALVASAGGHMAVTTVLRGLPADFLAPGIVMLHLGAESTATPEVLGRRLPFPVDWLKLDSTLTPGTVLICPPRSFVELLPDGTFRISASEAGALVGKPMDRLLESIARSFGERAVGVILTGMGSDSALGARQLHLAGGRVIVQSEATAEYEDMPRAAIRAGAADLVVPLQDIGQVIGEMVNGTPRPQPRSEIEAIVQVFGESGQVATLAREIDWAETELGPVRDWSETLRSTVRLAMNSPIPVTLWLGERAIRIMNEAAIPMLGTLFPGGFAKSAPETSPERYEPHRTSIARAWAGERVIRKAYLAPIPGPDKLEDAWWDVSFSPIQEPDGKTIGLYLLWQDRTADVLATRRLQILNNLASCEIANNRREALKEALAVLKESADIAFAVAYLMDASRKQALLVGAEGVLEGEGGIMAPHQITVGSAMDPWPLKQILQENKILIVDGLTQRFGDLQNRQDQVLPESAILYPLHDGADGGVIGALVLGMNPRLPVDDLYRNFLNLVTETISSKVAQSHAWQRESERLERLAELDRTKTEFFANISHEFRTPLTLLLAPLEDLLRYREQLPASLAEEVDVAAANSRRLLRLVNSLLDFSQIDSHRQQANFEPTDLCALTTNIASAFRSAIEAAGLRLRVECDPHLQPVWVDHDMWEKIVSNLLSNAFKFTFEGEIAIELRALSLHAELTVRDTGIGIPQAEIPNLFKRFHRVRGARARTVEGAGIGLSIVEDLVKRMSGQLTVRSVENKGSAFTVWIPYKSVRIGTEAAAGPSAKGANDVVMELARDASRWLSDVDRSPDGVTEDLLGLPSAVEQVERGRILIADDNADMREYLQRLLSPRWEVQLAADGASALKAALHNQPDAILADVMMPGLDGFELLKQIRANPALTHTPVIFLTARAGEEAAIQGLMAGADDYIAKPFSPRELVARVQAAVERARAEAALRESESRLQTVLQALPVGVWITDVDGRIIGKNKQSDKIWAGNAPLVEGVDQYHQYQSWDAISGKELETEDFPLTRTLRTGKSVEAEEHRIRRLDGSTGFVLVSAVPIKDDEGRLTGAVAINLDVTDRKRAAEERERLLTSISEYSEKLATIVGSITDEVWFANANGTLTLLNPQARTNLGLDFNTGDSVDDVVNALEILNPDGTLRSREDTPLLKSLKGEKITGEEIIRHRRTGELRYRMFSSIPVRDTKGDIIGAVATSTDITERKHREANLAFLAEVSKDLSRLTNIEETMNAIGEKIGTYFKLSHCLFIERDEGGETSTINYGWHRSDVPEVRGIYRVRDFLEAEFAERSMRGEVIVVRDTASDPLTDAKQFAKLGICSFVTVPLLRAGELRFWLAIYDSVPRNWRDDEIELLREITTGIWTRLERARAEEALRLSEDKYRTLFDSIDEGFCIIEVIFDEMDKPVDYRFFEINAAFENQTGILNGVGKRMREIQPHHEEHWFEIYGKVALTGEPVRFENPAAQLGRFYDVYAFRIGVPEEHRVAILFNDITERKRREANLAFLAEVSQDLVHLTNIEDTINVLGEKIGQFFDVKQCMFAEHADEFETSIASNGWHAPGTPDLKGIYRMRDFLGDEMMSLLLTGEPLVVNETQTDARVSAASYGALGIRSFIIVPLIRSGKWQFQLSIIDNKPRVWRSDEIELIQELTARIWTRLEHTRAEAALQESEEKYRTLFENMTEMFQILEPLFSEDGRVRDFRYIKVNRATELLTGKKREEMEGKTALEVWGYVEDYWFEMLGRALKSNEPVHMIDYSRTLDLYYDVNAWKADEHNVAIVFSNITERMRAEEALAKSEEKYRTLFNSIDEGVATMELILDDEGRTTDWLYLEHNPALARLTGISQDIVGKKASDIYQSLEPFWMETFGRVVREGTSQRFEYGVAELGNRWFDVYAARVGGPGSRQLVLVYNNATERKRAEEALRESEARYRAFIMASSDIVYRMSPDWKEIRYLKGKGFLEDTADANALWIEKYILEEDRPFILGLIEKSIQNKTVFELEHRLIRADGTIGWSFSRAVPMLNEQGEITEWLGTVRDVTERVRTEEKPPRSNGKLKK